MRRPRRRSILTVAGLLVLCSLCLGGLGLFFAGRPLPIEVKHTPFEGVVYRRSVRFVPRPIIAHIVTIDLKAPGLRFLVTPPDDTGRKVEYPLLARTTSQFLEESGLQLAINGDGFHPWYSNSLADYYPHAGDPVTPNGYAAARGVSYSDGPEPTVFINQNNVVSFNEPKGKVFNAVSGDRMLVSGGEPLEGLDDQDADPRTAIGLDRSGKTLILIVVDGRQPFYSQGVTVDELARMLVSYGAYTAMNLDGGGSSALVIEGQDGQPRLLNSPIDNYIPGRERPVANHLGVFVGE